MPVFATIFLSSRNTKLNYAVMPHGRADKERILQPMSARADPWGMKDSLTGLKARWVGRLNRKNGGQNDDRRIEYCVPGTAQHHAYRQGIFYSSVFPRFLKRD